MSDKSDGSEYYLPCELCQGTEVVPEYVPCPKCSASDAPQSEQEQGHIPLPEQVKCPKCERRDALVAIYCVDCGTSLPEQSQGEKPPGMELRHTKINGRECVIWENRDAVMQWFAKHSTPSQPVEHGPDIGRALDRLRRIDKGEAHLVKLSGYEAHTIRLHLNSLTVDRDRLKELAEHNEYWMKRANTDRDRYADALREIRDCDLPGDKLDQAPHYFAEARKLARTALRPEEE